MVMVSSGEVGEGAGAGAMVVVVVVVAAAVVVVVDVLEGWDGDWETESAGGFVAVVVMS